jgi:hypothetical protein
MMRPGRASRPMRLTSVKAATGVDAVGDAAAQLRNSPRMLQAPECRRQSNDQLASRHIECGVLRLLRLRQRRRCSHRGYGRHEPLRGVDVASIAWSSKRRGAQQSQHRDPGRLAVFAVSGKPVELAENLAPLVFRYARPAVCHVDALRRVPASIFSPEGLSE